MKKLDFLGKSGQILILLNQLYGKTIIAVYRDGVGVTEILTGALDPPPVGKKSVKFYNLSSVMYFGVPLTIREYILILYKD